MNKAELLNMRLRNQLVSHHPLKKAGDVARHLGAVQAQDFLGAAWGLGLRLPSATQSGVEEAFNRGEFLRLHVMRGTWHFVAPEDVYWMLRLSAERMSRGMERFYQNAGLDAKGFAKAEELLTKMLSGQVVQRASIKATLRAAGFPQVGEQFTYIMLHAETQGLVCSGPRQGKQFTYALVEDRVPKQRQLSRKEGLLELTRRYFTSHGPASEKDFSWWSGQSVTDTRKALGLLGAEFSRVDVDGTAYWYAGDAQPATGGTWLLPNYDEYTVAYADRSHFFDERFRPQLDTRSQAIFQNVIVSNGEVSGTWRRTFAKGSIHVELAPFEAVSAKEKDGLLQAAEAYADFQGMELKLSFA